MFYLNSILKVLSFFFIQKTKSSHNKQIEINATDSAHMKVKYSPLVENNVFDEIGDDDL